MRKKSFPRSILIIAATLAPALGYFPASQISFATTEALNPEALAVKFWARTQTSEADPSVGKIPALTGIAGDAIHDVWNVEALRVLPASRSVSKHRRFAAELAAEDAHVWYVIRGRSANASFDKREFRGNDIDIIDGDGNEYRPSWSPGIFQPESMLLRTTPLDPGQYKHWLAFFEIPDHVSGLQLRVNNMANIEKQFSTIAIDDIQTPIQKTIGSIHHNITELHQLTEIPAQWTIEKYADRAMPTPAKEGNKWIVAVGETINGGKDARRLSSREYILMDDNGNEYRSTSPGYRYKTPETGVRHGWLDPGASVNWKLFFSIPTALQNPRLRVGNLSSARKESTTIPLSDIAILLQATQPVAANIADVAGTSQTAAGVTMAAVGSSTDELQSIDQDLIDLGNTRVVTGEVEHVLISAEVLATIPATRLTKEWKDLGVNDELPAPENMVWIHVNGSSKNNAQEELSLKATFILIDNQNREYEANVNDTQLYVPEERSVLVNEVAPGETQEWEAWFLVHRDAKDIRIKLDDLTFLAEFTTEIPLPIDSTVIENGGVGQ